MLNNWRLAYRAGLRAGRAGNLGPIAPRGWFRSFLYWEGWHIGIKMRLVRELRAKGCFNTTTKG